jgi:accessory gene regulator protein AgrB
MYVSIYLFMYVCTYVSIYLSIYVCIYLFMYVSIYLFMYVCIYLSVCLSVWEHKCEHTKEEKYKIAAHKKKWKKHQEEGKVIKLKITSNQRAVHSVLKKKGLPEDGLVGPKHVVTALFDTF